MAGHGVRGETKASENRLAAAEKQRQALELRKAGYGFQQIADQLGYKSTASSYDAVNSALKKTLQQPADELRQLELERLDQIWKSIYPQMTKGHLGAIDRGVRVMQRRAELLGLDAPKDMKFSGEVGIRRYIGVDPEAV